MKSFKFKIHDNNYNVNVINHEANTIEIEVNGTAYNVLMKEEIKKSKTPTLVRSQAQSPNEPKKVSPSSNITKILAPIPGVVLAINVKVGDNIKVGDSLLILEAMKMENNITSETSGTVRSIKISPNQQVLQDEVLLELE